MNKRLVGWEGSLLSDPAHEEIVAFAKGEGETTLVANAKHADLLYTYRCNLVHESRPSGRGFEFSKEDTVPFYHSLTDLATGNETWELTYPEGFFFNIVGTALSNLKKHLLAEKINPYDSFTYGSAWSKK